MPAACKTNNPYRYTNREEYTDRSPSDGSDEDDGGGGGVDENENDEEEDDGNVIYGGS